MTMVRMVVVIVGMRVCDFVVCMLMRVLCVRSRWGGMGMIVMLIPVGMFVSMCDRIVGVRVRMLGHKYLPWCSLC